MGPWCFSGGLALPYLEPGAQGGVEWRHSPLIVDLGSGALTQLTSDPTYDGGPEWHLNGNLVAFESERNGSSEVFLQAADGTVHPSNPPRPYINLTREVVSQIVGTGGWSSTWRTSAATLYG